MNQVEAGRLFEYRNGGLFWRVNRGSNAVAGARAGRLLKTGYRSIHVSGRRYQEHRLVYLLHHGAMPAQIDHINGDKADNRIENLREATYSQNQMNTGERQNESGYRGVRFVPKTGRWAARIYENGKEIRIGTFASPELASEAYQKKAREIFGEFAR
ncbi:HNH endonuclease [Stutzerimonas stutzeri]|nr:HNH endonuclease [Stutzerimonas stutzeri]